MRFLTGKSKRFVQKINKFPCEIFSLNFQRLLNIFGHGHFLLGCAAFCLKKNALLLFKKITINTYTLKVNAQNTV